MIKTYKQFNITDLSLEKPRTTKTGNTYFNIKYPNKEDWVLQTPRCKVVFTPSFSMCICVILEFEEFIKEFDSFLLTNMAKELGKEQEEIPYSPLLNIFKENADTRETEDPSHKHSLEFIRINVSSNTVFFEEIDGEDVELQQHEAIASIKKGDEIKCLIKFKQGQIKKSRSSGEFVASVQMTLQQVKITKRYFEINENNQ